MILLALLPLAAFLGLLTTIHDRLASTENWDWRDSFAAASLAWGVYLFLLTEVLGALRLLTADSLALAWGLVCLVLLYLLREKTPSASRFSSGWLQSLGPWRSRLGNLQLLILCLTALCLAATLGVALLTPNNASDALEYHMGRVTHWAQNRSVSHYATPDARQLWSPPLAEYMILHFYVLQGNDSSANLIQWFSLLGAALVGSRLARRVGARPIGQGMAALMITALPIAIDQSTSALNDLTVAYWVVITAWALLTFARPPFDPLQAAAAGVSVGLALLTKGSALPYLLGLSLVVGIARWREIATRRGSAAIALMAAIALTVNAPHWSRNVISFGSPLGPVEHESSLRARGPIHTRVLSNNIRTVGVLAAVPPEKINAVTEQAVGDLHKILGLELNPPGATHPGAEFGVGWRWPGTNAAPVHLGLFGLAAVLLLAGRVKAGREEIILAIGSLLGLILFNSLVSWQGGSRFWIPALLLSAPWIASTLDRELHRGLILPAAIALVIFAGPVLIAHPARPLLSMPGYTFLPSVVKQADLLRYFRGNAGLAADYQALALEAQAQNCNQVGLRIDSGDPEYWWWVVLEPRRYEIKVEHLLVWPGLESYMDPGFQACVVLCTVCGEGRQSFAGLPIRNRLGSITIFY